MMVSLHLATDVDSLVCLKSGKKEGVEREDRKAIEFWDGEELPELHLTADDNGGQSGLNGRRPKGAKTD